MKRLLYLSIGLTVISWIAFMVSFWLPHPVGAALQATALSLGIPGVAAVCFLGVCWDEIETYLHRSKTRTLRCTDCGSKILNPAGTTIGDQLEGELMLENPRDKGRWP